MNDLENFIILIKECNIPVEVSTDEEENVEIKLKIVFDKDGKVKKFSS